MLNIKELIYNVRDSLNADDFTLNLCVFFHLEVNNPESSQKLSVCFASTRKVIRTGENPGGDPFDGLIL